MQSKKSKQFVAGVLGVAMALSFVFVGAAAPAQAQSVDSLTAQINSLLATIASLQAQLATMQGGSSGTTAGHVFNTDLTVGSKGADVTALQQILVSKGYLTMPSGVAMGYFGSLTKTAVSKWQAASGISPTAGYFGPKSRAAMNAMSSTTGGTTTGGTTTGGTTVPAGSGLSVVAATQPGPQLAPPNAARVPFTKVTLTAGSSDVTVNGITVTRVGPSVDANFAGVVLLDANGQQVGVAKTLNSVHQVTVGDTFTVKAGTSVTYTIAGNMAGSAQMAAHAGEVAGLQVTAVNTSAPVTGALPISGTMQTINGTLTIGSVTLNVSSFDPSSGSSQNIGTTGYRFAGIRVTAGSAEDVTLWSIRWNQSGSASASDLANIVTVVDGVQYPTTVSADGKYYTTLFGSGLVIQKGFAKDIYVQGDIVGSGAAGRTVQFDIYKQTDLYLSGNTYGFGITPPVTGTGTISRTTTSSSGFTTTNPWFQSVMVTVNAGTLTTISNATAVAAQNIAVNVPNQVLGGYVTDIKGEPISVQSSVFTVATSSGSGYGLLTNVSIVDENGAVVAGPVDATYTSATSQTLTFTDTITYPVGKHTYTLKGKVASTIGNGTIYAVTSTNSNWTTVTGQTTGNSITLPTFSVTMNQMTVKSAALAVSVSSNPAAQNIISGTVGQLFTNYQFDASQSGEDVRFSSLALTLTPVVNSATNLTGCQMFDGTTALNTGSNVVNPTTNTPTVTFDTSLTVPKGTVKTLSWKCNVATGLTTGSFAWGITGGVGSQIASIQATGVTSSNSITPTGTTAVGPVMSVGVGSLTVSTDASSPSYTIVAAGSTGVTSGVLKFHATNDSVNLQRIVLRLTNTASSSSSDLVQATLWDGSTQIGTATFTGTNSTATSSLTTPVLITKDTDHAITVKLDLTDVGISQPVTGSGHLLAVDIDSTDTTGTKGTGVGSGGEVDASGSTAVAGVRIMASVPTLALDTLSSSGASDGRLMRFKVTADNAGPVSIAQLKFNFATSSTNYANVVTGVNVFGFTDSGYSQPVAGVNTGGQFMASNVNPSGSSAPYTATIYPQTTGAVNTYVQVPAGTTRYFEVRGTVVGSGTSWSVTTTLTGDSSYPAAPPLLVNCDFDSTTVYPTCNTSAGQASSSASSFMASSTALSASAFIWSPDSTSTSALSTNDWTNGYGVLGLPSSGLIQTRTN